MAVTTYSIQQKEIHKLQATFNFNINRELSY